MPKRKQSSEPKSKAKKEQEEPIAASSDEIEDLDDAPSSSGDDDAFPSEEEDDEESSGDDEDGEAFDSIDVNFEFFDPTEDDFHGLKTLLTHYLDGEQFSSSELVDAIISNPAGTVIKCGEDDDPIGIASVLPFEGYSSSKFLQEIKSFVLKRCPKSKEADLKAAWVSPTTALLISDRLLNCPPQLAPPLMDSLMKETKEMAKSGNKISQYIFITRAYVDPTATAGPPQGGKKAAKKAKKGSEKSTAPDKGSTRISDLIFATPEGEFLANKASVAFSFPIPNRAVGKDDLEPHRVVTVIPAKEVAGALREMKEVVEGGNA